MFPDAIMYGLTSSKHFWRCIKVRFREFRCILDRYVPQTWPRFCEHHVNAITLMGSLLWSIIVNHNNKYFYYIQFKVFSAESNTDCHAKLRRLHGGASSSVVCTAILHRAVLEH